MSIVLLCGDQLLTVTSSFSSARCIRWKGFALTKFLVVVSCVIIVTLLDKAYSNSNLCLFGDLPSASTRVRHFRAAVAGYPLIWSFRCRGVSLLKTMKTFIATVRSFLIAQVHMYNDILHTVFDTGTLNVLGSSQLLIGSLSSVSSCFPWRRCLWGWE